jgi:hypothetical protein
MAALTLKRPLVLECERLFIMRQHQLALQASLDCLNTERQESNSSSHCSKVIGTREKALGIAIQALYELGRPEESFALVRNYYSGRKLGKSFEVVSDVEVCCADIGKMEMIIHPSVLKILYLLRMNLDETASRASLLIIEPYINKLISQCEKSDCESVVVDEEIIECYILKHILRTVSNIRYQDMLMLKISFLD